MREVPPKFEIFDYRMEITSSGPIFLTEREQEVLEIIRQDHTVSYRKIAQIVDINESEVKKNINMIKSKGILERKGGTRGYWHVK